MMSIWEVETSSGMSQTLALIVAASVLMMTALTVIFLAQGSLSSLGQDATAGACKSAVNSKCKTAIKTQSTNQPTVQTPGACIDSEGNPITLQNSPRWSQGVDSADTVTCKDASGSTNEPRDDIYGE